MALSCTRVFFRTKVLEISAGKKKTDFQEVKGLVSCSPDYVDVRVMTRTKTIARAAWEAERRAGGGVFALAGCSASLPHKKICCTVTRDTT